MYKITIKNSSGSEDFEIPGDCSEMKLRQYIDFIKHYDKWVLITQKNGNIFAYESIMALADIVAKFLDVPIKKIFGIEIFHKDISEGIKALSSDSKDTIDAKNLQDGLMSIVRFIKKIIDSVEPEPITDENCMFEYSGPIDKDNPDAERKVETFILPFYRSHEFLKDKTRPPLILGEVVEMMEKKRMFAAHKEDMENDYIKKKKVQLDIDPDDEDDKTKVTSEGYIHDPDGNYMLEEALNTLAVLALKEGEMHIPSMDTETFVKNRMWYFIDIDFQTWANVNFFLTNIGKELSLTKDTIISLILLREMQMALSQKSTMN
jgi:hypothetical protein